MPILIKYCITYKLTKFQKTNQGTSINLRPIVKNGEKVKKEEYVSRKIRIKEGYANEDMQEIISDELKDGMEIVVSGQYSLEDDDIVTIN